jgi:hypothetical protein
MADPENVKEIFARYARVRQTRVSREDAWKRVKADADALNEDERKRVMALVRDWEIIEGHRYKPARADDPYATMFTPPKGLKEARDQLKAEKEAQAQTDKAAVSPSEAPSEPAADTTDKAGAAGETTKQAVDTAEVAEAADQASGAAPPTAALPDGAVSSQVTLTCPVCQHQNPLDVARCVNCGAVLPQTKDVSTEMDKLSLLDNGAKAHIAPDMALKFEFVETNQVLRVPLTLDQMVIGRSSSGGLIPPDVDLAPYGAQSKGVSRYHASLQRKGDTLLLMDLQSLNHTLINGQRLYPHEVRVLRDGDEVRFGQLAVRIYFLP